MDNKLYEMMDWAAVEGIVYSEEDHPHDILGAHVTEEGILIQTFLPTAKSVTVVLKDSKKEYPMDLEDEEGFFAALLPGKKIPKYHYHVDFGEEADGKENIVEYEDPYRFACRHLLRYLRKTGITSNDGQWCGRCFVCSMGTKCYACQRGRRFQPLGWQTSADEKTVGFRYF